jgi:hypothetical protein
MTAGMADEQALDTEPGFDAGVQRFRKRPIVVEARQFCSVNGSAVAEWCGGRHDDVLHRLIIHTLEGDIFAQSGDWVIKGVQGEFYPVRADILAETYDPVADGPAGAAEGYAARVELMGHRQHIGRVTEVTLAGAPMLRVQAADGTVAVFPAGSLYCLTPLPEEALRRGPEPAAIAGGVRDDWYADDYGEGGPF